MTELSPTPTGEEVAAAVERLTKALDDFAHDFNDAVDLGEHWDDAMEIDCPDLRTVLAALTKAQAEVERLRMAIMGGEDAPGYAMSLDLATVLKVAAENSRAWMAASDRATAAEAENARLREVVEAARDLVMKPGGLVNRGVGVGLVVVEKADKSDPHYRLCSAFERLDRAAVSPTTEG